MNMPWRAVLIIALIAVLLAAYGLWSRRDGDGVTERAAAAQAGYYLQDATVTETNATGAARFKLHAKQITQNPSNDSIDLQQVQLDYQSAPDSQWLLTAERGHLVTGSRVIDFTGNVNITPKPPTNNQVELHTDILSIDTENSIATAPNKVDFAMDRQNLNAFGLKYDLKRQKLRLESRVHGQFQAK